MKTQTNTNLKKDNVSRFRRIRHNRRKMWDIWFYNLQLWMEIFADLAGRLARFLWKYRKVIVRSLISLTLIVSTIMIVGTFSILSVFRMLIAFVEESGYTYSWQATDVVAYERLSTLKNAFVSINPMAELMTSMGATFCGSIFRMLMPFVIVIITRKWFAPLFKKN